MAAKIIDGKAIAADIRAEVKAEAERLRQERGITPGLATVLVGDDPASLLHPLPVPFTRIGRGTQGTDPHQRSDPLRIATSNQRQGVPPLVARVDQ